VNFLFFGFKISHYVQILYRYKVHFLEFKETRLEYLFFLKRPNVFEFFCRILYSLNPEKITKSEANCINLE